jgi:hypothetical protein
MEIAPVSFRFSEVAGVIFFVITPRGENDLESGVKKLGALARIKRLSPRSNRSTRAIFPKKIQEMSHASSLFHILYLEKTSKNGHINVE